MKHLCNIATIIVLLGISAFPALADVNEELSFSNNTDEPLHIELYVEEGSDWALYDLYADSSGCRYANFWALRPFSAYSVCAYGELTDDFYGCIESDIDTDGWDNHIVFDNSGHPYLSDAPFQECDTYYYETADSPPDIIFAIHDDGYDHEASVSCFIGSSMVNSLIR